MKKSFSVIILCYRHFKYLYSAIDSVLAQNYENIELVISDDGSCDFPQKDIEVYIEKNKGDNIKRVILRQEQVNCGTVRNFNHAIDVCTGEFIIALAGDDTLYDEQTLSNYAKGFENAPQGCSIEMAQTGMYDYDLTKLQSYYVKQPVQKAIEKTKADSRELLKLLLIHKACLPSTSTCFRRDFFDKHGKFDEEFVLIEDYPMHLKLAREGCVIHYENFVAIKHRDGGISHGQKGATSKSSILYYKDLQKIILTLIIPNIHILTENEQKSIMLTNKRELRWIQVFLAKAEKKYFDLIILALNNPLAVMELGIQKMWPVACHMHIKLLVLTLIGWFLSPTISQMAETVLGSYFDISAQQLLFIVYAFFSFTFVLWSICFIFWMLNIMLWTIKRFPSETIAIG